MVTKTLEFMVNHAVRSQRIDNTAEISNKPTTKFQIIFSQITSNDDIVVTVNDTKTLATFLHSEQFMSLAKKDIIFKSRGALKIASLRLNER